MLSEIIGYAQVILQGGLNLGGGGCAGGSDVHPNGNRMWAVTHQRAESLHQLPPLVVAISEDVFDLVEAQPHAAVVGDIAEGRKPNLAAHHGAQNLVSVLKPQVARQA